MKRHLNTYPLLEPPGCPPPPLFPVYQCVSPRSISPKINYDTRQKVPGCHLENVNQLKHSGTVGCLRNAQHMVIRSRFAACNWMCLCPAPFIISRLGFAMSEIHICIFSYRIWRDNGYLESPVNFSSWMVYGVPSATLTLFLLWLWLAIFYLGPRWDTHGFGRHTPRRMEAKLCLVYWIHNTK